jgi:hypothetical protein
MCAMRREEYSSRPFPELILCRDVTIVFLRDSSEWRTYNYVATDAHGFRHSGSVIIGNDGSYAELKRKAQDDLRDAYPETHFEYTHHMFGQP